MMTRGIAIVVVFLVCGTCSALNTWEIPLDNLLYHVTRDLDNDWLKYKKAFNKTYDSANEELRRRLIWEDAVRYIREHNDGYQAGKYSFPLAENQFADMADDEFRKTYLSGMGETESTKAEQGSTNVSTIESVLRSVRDEIPQWWPGQDVDWREKGYVTPVQNQGACSSCWAFATVAALEGLYRRKSGQLRKLSEQNLLDCVDGSYTCANGGEVKKACRYVEKSGGIDLESCYGYNAPPKVNPACRYKGSCSVRLSNFKSKKAKSGDEEYLMQVISALGPVAVGIDAAHNSFRFYGGNSTDDVYYEKECYPKNYMTHAVTIVGYGTSTNGDYWIVKNSWGTGWGDNGYIYMARNRGNNCGIADRAIFLL